MKVIRETEFKTCGECERRTLVKNKAYGCDNCDKEIDLAEGHEYLDATVFRHNDEDTDHLVFCSWKCCIETLRVVKTDYFITLPMLSFDGKEEGMQPEDFFKMFKEGIAA